MGKDYQKIPSSIIAEGLDIWEGAGDRGDAAMYLYGLSRFLLAYGDKKLAEEYFSALYWCAEYCKLKLNDGVIESDSDELEGRFPSGNANLCTNSLAYAGLMSASDIACELGYKEKEIELTQFAGELRINIEKYFGFRLSGYDTYRYYKENTLLRSWICIPLTMGILDRSEGTVNALLSDRLFGENGLVCQEGDTTFWDRSTLYALRGIFNAGKSDDVYRFLNYYTCLLYTSRCV